jgi:Rrf2 family protein
MLELGIHYDKGPIFLKEIAGNEAISEKYLGQIIIPLKTRGLVNAYRGAHGGYVLSRPASLIRLREIVETLEGDLSLVDCVGNSAVCGRSAACVTRDVWNGMGSLIIEFLDSITLEDLVRKYRANSGEREPMADFSI